MHGLSQIKRMNNNANELFKDNNIKKEVKPTPLTKKQKIVKFLVNFFPTKGDMFECFFFLSLILTIIYTLVKLALRA